MPVRVETEPAQLRHPAPAVLKPIQIIELRRIAALQPAAALQHQQPETADQRAGRGVFDQHMRAEAVKGVAVCSRGPEAQGPQGLRRGNIRRPAGKPGAVLPPAQQNVRLCHGCPLLQARAAAAARVC